VPFDWRSLLAQIGSTAVVVAAVAWVAKRAIDQWLDHRLEQHKRDLANTSDRALERLRHELRLEEVRHSRLLARQASIIAGVFARLERLHQALIALSVPILHQGGNGPQLRDAAIKRHGEFIDYYYERAIWLDKDTCNRLNDLLRLLEQLLTRLNYNLTPDGSIVDRQRWSATYDQIQEEVPKARGALDEHFRQLLGVSQT